MATNVKMEKKNTLMYVKFRNICRTCFTSNGKLYSIFDNENLIITMLNTISGIKVEKNNYNKDMPSKICENCLRNMNNFFQFRQKCKNIQTKIEKMFSCFNEIDKNEYIYLIKKHDSLDQNVIIKQIVDSNLNTFECEGHIVLKSNANLDQADEYNVKESLGKTVKHELTEIYEEKWHDENEDSLDIPENKKVITDEKEFEVDIKSEPNPSPKLEPQHETQNLMCKTEQMKFINIKTKSNANPKQKLRSKLKTRKSRCIDNKSHSTRNVVKRKKNSDSYSSIQTPSSEKMAAFLCGHCGKKFKVLYNLIRHEKIHTGERPYKCEICNKSFIQSFNLKEHMFIHNKTKDCECNYCHKVFSRPISLKKHQKRFHQHASSLETSHQCTVCSKSFSSILGLNAHARVHSVDSDFECTKCQIKFSSEHFLTEHNLLRHCDNKLSDKDFTCSICNKELFGFAALVSHQEVHASFLCDYCGKSCLSKHSFVIHLRQHTGERPFPCVNCTKRFASKANLRNHTKSVHSDIRRYACDVCPKKFRRCSHLSVHKRIHTGEKPFSCEFCNKRFRVKDSAEVHSRVHTGERPYNCDNCTQTFSYLSNFNKHKQKCKADIKASK